MWNTHLGQDSTRSLNVVAFSLLSSVFVPRSSSYGEGITASNHVQQVRALSLPRRQHQAVPSVHASEAGYHCQRDCRPTPGKRIIGPRTTDKRRRHPLLYSLQSLPPTIPTPLRLAQMRMQSLHFFLLRSMIPAGHTDDLRRCAAPPSA